MPFEAFPPRPPHLKTEGVVGLTCWGLLGGYLGGVLRVLVHFLVHNRQREFDQRKIR